MGSHDDEGAVLENSLLQNESNGLYTGDGSVDRKGKPALRNRTGQWKACSFILGTFFCERLAFYGISTNLVNYLLDTLHKGTVNAAKDITNWKGTCYLTPLIGAIVADTYWGRYWTIAGFTTVYLMGMVTLTLSASMSAFKPAECVESVCPSATTEQYAVFITALYLIALGTGGIKPCIWPFGADQFDDTDPKERVKKGSYFNWFYFSQNIGAIIASSLLVWIQDKIGWGIGFGIPTVVMVVCIASLFLGTSLYRFHKPGGSPLTRIGQVLVASFRKRNLNVLEGRSILYETKDTTSSAIEGSRKLEHSNELRCLDKAAVVSDAETECGDLSNPWRLCTVTQVEELKILIRMLPILAAGIVFSAVFAQMSTLFVVQGKMMDRVVGSVTIPAASLSLFNSVSIIIWVPIYDRAVIPIVKRYAGNERGFSQLQRMEIGLFVSIVCMSAAALVETKRLQLAKELGLTDKKVAVPLSILWQIPQYFLIGAAEVFTFVGQHEFFYEQAPDAMRSLCSALSLLTNSLGNYLSTLILTVVTFITTKGGSPGWIPNNLNEGHLDYFYLLLSGLSFLNLLVYMIFSRKYKEKKAA